MKSTTINITERQYREIAKKIIEEIVGRNYFSGSFEFEWEEYSARMLTTLIIYYTQVSRPEGEATIISDVIPVWWELHTMGEEGEVLNDFSFNELRNYIKDLRIV